MQKASISANRLFLRHVQKTKPSDQLWLHESTQRMLVRMAIVMLGLLPLLAAFSFVTVSRTQWYQLRQAAAWRSRILSNTGLDAVFASIELPSPNRFVIRDMVFSDPETKTSILWADEVHGEMTSSGWAVSIGTAHLKPEKTDLALKILHDQFLCRPHNSVPILKLTMGELQLMLGAGADSTSTTLQALQDILVEYEPSHQTSEIKVRYVVKDAGQQSPSKVHVVRSHDSTNPKTEWAIDTHDGALPCSVLARYFPVLSNLGTLAEFRGQVRWAQDALGWDCRIENGRFDRCSWEQLTQTIGRPLEGSGSLHLYNAKLKNGTLEFAQGGLMSSESEEVFVKLDWLKESVRAFQWATEDLSKIQVARAKVSGLSLKFDLNHKGVQWFGSDKILPEPSQPHYRQVAVVEGALIAAPHERYGISTDIVAVSHWLDRSTSAFDSSIDSSVNSTVNSTVASSGDASSSATGTANATAVQGASSRGYSRWQSQMAALLPPPAPMDAPVGRVSSLPSR